MVPGEGRMYIVVTRVVESESESPGVVVTMQDL